jgi:3-deoxy-manno-octulosonate cytidylyltransferase (CMP-KDO synthetase)
MPAVVVIPARFASSRLPGKPLLRATGKYLIQHVYEQASRAKRVEAVVVATDDERIVEAVRSFGGQAVMTRPDHQSGTDRIAEVMRMPEFQRFHTVVNVQGDEPEIKPEIIDDLVRITRQVDVPMATVSAPFANWNEIKDPNKVKVVVDQRGMAIYFSRSVIPFDRDGQSASATMLELAGIYRKHLGIYAYQRSFLLTLCATPLPVIEQLEKLEQLRALFLGVKIFVQDIAEAPAGIDTPADYAAFIERSRSALI